MDFQTYVVDLMNKAASVRSLASQEYAVPTDVLNNFKVVADVMLLEPSEVLCVFLMKHIVSITRNVSLRESMEGRIIDAINYLLLLGYMLEQENEIGQND